MSDVEKAISGKEKQDGIAFNHKQTNTTTPSATTVTVITTKNSTFGVHNDNGGNGDDNGDDDDVNGCGSALATSAGTVTTKAVTVGDSNSIVTDSTVQHKNTSSCTRNCLGILIKIVFSTPGLVVLVCAYSVLGALIFPLLEAPQDFAKSAAIAKSREDCLRELWIITEKLNVLYERNWTMLVHEQLRRFEGSIVAATRQGASSSSQATLNALGRFGGSYPSDGIYGQESWSFSEALLYSVTVITTIGHGSLTPKTAAGKIATIFYALIGVPLMLMCLSSLGTLLAEALRSTYVRLCCQLQASLGRSRKGDKTQQHQHQHKRRCSSSVDSLDNIIDGQSANGLNCKNCKYDALSTETSLTNGYDGYGSKRKLSIERIETEDACQLLRCNASPGKLQQNQQQQQQQHQSTPCMQIKMATAVTPAIQYYQQRQQQTDVMLMTTASAPGGVAAASNPMATPTMQQKFNCTRSATPSPQHLQQQQQYFVAATNGTTTSTTLPRMHHQYQPSTQQHYVAVPSGILRFSLANAGNAPMPPNCYTAPTGSATIYFPIATATSNNINIPTNANTHCQQQQQHQQQQPPLSLPPPPSPLVKYHTIQLQPAATKRLVVSNEGVVVSSASSAAAAASSSFSPASSLSATAAPTTIALTTNTTTTTGLDAMNMTPLPPPPAYQTATVHGIRRAKFLTKPLPHELNTLLANNSSNNDTDSIGTDVGYRHDLLRNTLTTSPVTSATQTGTAGAATTAGPKTGDNTLIATGACSPALAITSSSSASALCSTGAASVPATGIMSGATTTLHYDSSATVDIMDEEDEHEQQRLGNCPHGTPSRVPLIASSTKSHNCSTASVGSTMPPPAGMQTRGLLNATAASFHRHTLHSSAPGQRPGKAHSLLLTRRGCQMHQGVRGATLYDSAATTETSDDDDAHHGMYMQHGSERFMLKKLKLKTRQSLTHRRSASFGCLTESEFEADEDADNEDDDREVNSHYSGNAQVPISIVLLILICYISVGTFIFAFYENWSLIDGAYFCFVTLSTIGYGDFVPMRTFQGPELQLFACCAYLLLGLVLVAMAFSILETQLMWKCKRIAVRLKLAKD